MDINRNIEGGGSICARSISYAFEQLIRDLAEAMGYSAYLTPRSGDHGVDVFVESTDTLANGRIVISAKRYSSTVGPDHVRALDAVDLAAEERGPSQVRASWTVTIKITDAADVRELALAACPVTDQAARAEIEASFAAAWQWAADPCAPMTGIPGVTWTCVEVVVEQVLARSR